MGAISKASGERTSAPTFADLVKSCAPQFQSVMSRGCTPERLVQMTIAAYKQTPKLSECSVPSILSCAMQCAALNLEPSAVDGLGRAYILPYYNGRTRRMEAQFVLGKNGMVELMQRSGQIVDMTTQPVYEGDEFDFFEDETGRHFTFRPSLDAEHSPDRLRLVYFSAHLRDGGFAFRLMSKAEIDAVRARSKAAESGPWKTDYEAMAEKTVLRRAFGRRDVPVSVEVERAVAADGSTPVFVDQNGEVVGLPDDMSVLPEPQACEPVEPEVEGAGEAGGDAD